MKKLIASFAILASVCAFAAIDSTTVIAGSKGPDKYADGTVAIDGECYALVWSADEFGGFNADGTLVNAADQILVISARAQGGACPLFAYEVPYSLVSKGGNVSLWLLDTRVYGADGVKPALTAGTVAAKVDVIKGAAKADAAISMSGAGAKSIGGAEGGAVATATADAGAAVAKAVEETKVESLKVENGYAIIELGNTKPFVAYDLASGATPDAISADDKAAYPVSGAAAGKITLIKKVDGKSGFFKVVGK